MGNRYPTVKVIPHNLNVVWHEGFTEPLVGPGIYKIVPVDALVVEKDNGEWPVWALTVFESTWGVWRSDAKSVLDVLAAGEKGADDG